MQWQDFVNTVMSLSVPCKVVTKSASAEQVPVFQTQRLDVDAAFGDPGVRI
jgi:hypothetical protein